MNLSPTYSVRKHEDQGCSFRQISRDGIRVVLEVTGRCNLHCRHCFACAENNELSTNKWIGIINQFPDVNVKKVILTGGEPLLRTDLEQIIQIINSSGIGVDLNTNLIDISADRAKKLKISGLSEISSSLDGLEKYHDWFRQNPGNFNKVIEGIKTVVKLGFEVDIHGVCTPGNISDIPEVINICNQIGVASFTLLSVVSRDLGGASVKGNEFTLTKNDKHKLKLIIEKERSIKGNTIMIRTVNIFKQAGTSFCPMGNTVIGITPSGKLKPCLLSGYLPCESDDLTRYKLKEALQSMKKRVDFEGRHLLCVNEQT